MKKVLISITLCAVFALAAAGIYQAQNPEKQVFPEAGEFVEKAEDSLKSGFEAAGDQEASKKYLQEKIPKLKKAFESSLQRLGIGEDTLETLKEQVKSLPDQAVRAAEAVFEGLQSQEEASAEAAE